MVNTLRLAESQSLVRQVVRVTVGFCSVTLVLLEVLTETLPKVEPPAVAERARLAGVTVITPPPPPPPPEPLFQVTVMVA